MIYEFETMDCVIDTLNTTENQITELKDKEEDILSKLQGTTCVYSHDKIKHIYCIKSRAINNE